MLLQWGCGLWPKVGRRGLWPNFETRRAWPVAEGHRSAAVGGSAVAVCGWPETASSALRWFLTQLVFDVHLLGKPEHDFPVVHFRR